MTGQLKDDNVIAVETNSAALAIIYIGVTRLSNMHDTPEFRKDALETCKIAASLFTTATKNIKRTTFPKRRKSKRLIRHRVTVLNDTHKSPYLT